MSKTTTPTTVATVDLITTTEELEPVADDWRRLAELRGNAFVTPEWFSVALRVLEPDAAPHVAVARDEDGALVGVLPLVRAGTGRRRRLRFAGARYADLVHPAADAADEATVAARAASCLADAVGRRCPLDLGRVDASSSWWSELARARPGRARAVTGPLEALPYADLAGLDWDGYLATRSGQFRNQVRRKSRALARDHEVVLSEPGSAEEVRPRFELLLRLHDARWRDRPEETALGDEAGRRFLAEFAVAAYRRGWLRLYGLEVDGETVAAWCGWRLGGRFSYYQAGFDPAWSKQSVGFLMLARTVEAAIAEGAEEYDLLLGDEAFKERFATARRQGHSALVTPSLSTARLSATAKEAARTGVRALPVPLRERVRVARRRIAGGA